MHTWQKNKDSPCHTMSKHTWQNLELEGCLIYMLNRVEKMRMMWIAHIPMSQTLAAYLKTLWWSSTSVICCQTAAAWIPWQRWAAVSQLYASYLAQQSMDYPSSLTPWANTYRNCKWIMTHKCMAVEMPVRIFFCSNAVQSFWTLVSEQ